MRKFLYTIVLGIVFWLWGVVGAVAQNNPYRIDDSLYPLYTEAFQHKDEKLGLQLADSLLHKAVAIGDKQAEMGALTIPVYYYFTKDISFQEYLEKAVKPLAAKAEAYKSQSTYYMGENNAISFLCNRGLFTEAMLRAARVQNYAREQNHQLGTVLSLRIRGVVYHARGEFGRAMQAFQESIDYAAKYLPKYFNMANYQSLALCYRYMGDFEKMLQVVQEGLAKATAQEHRFVLQENRCYAYYLLGRDKEFLALSDSLEQHSVSLYLGSAILRKVVEIGRKTLRGDHKGALRLIGDMKEGREKVLAYAQYYSHLGEHAKAQPYYQEMLEYRYKQDENNIRKDLKNMEKELGDLRLQQQHEQTERENAQLELENVQLELEHSSLQLEGARSAARLARLESEGAAEKLESQRLANRRVGDSLSVQRMNQELSRRQMRRESYFFIGFLSVSFLVILQILYHLYMIYKNTRNLQNSNLQIRQSNSELDIARERAQEGNRMKTQFVQNMSHEIRTPLNAIAGFSQVLHEMGEDLSEEEQREMHKMIRDNANLLITLVDDILDLAALESGKYTLEMNQVQVNELCRQMLETVRHRLPQGVTLNLKSGVDDAFCITTDRKRTSQVLINLLTNAEKNTTRGSITLTTSLQEHPGKITFAVEDTGIGVPKDKMKSIFQRFKKLDNHKQGAGLGLDICRTITTKMGGEIDIDPNYTPGARFWFTIPVRALIVAGCLFLGTALHAQSAFTGTHPELQQEIQDLYEPVYEAYGKENNLEGLNKALEPLLQKTLKYGLLDDYYQAASYRSYYLMNNLMLPEALADLEQTQAFLQDHFSHYGMFSLYRTLGVIYRFRGDYNLSIEKLHEAIAYARENFPSLDSNQNYVSLCINYRRLMDYTGLLACTEEAKHASRISQTESNKLLANRCYALFALGRYEEFRRLYPEFEAVPFSTFGVSKNTARAVQAFKKQDEGNWKEMDAVLRSIDEDSEMQLASVICAKRADDPNRLNEALRQLLIAEFKQKQTDVDIRMAAFGVRLNEQHRALDQARAKNRNAQLELQHTRLKLETTTLEVNNWQAEQQLAMRALKNDSLAIRNQKLQQGLVQDSLARQQILENDLKQEYDLRKTLFYISLLVAVLVFLITAVLLQLRRRQRKALRKVNEKLHETNAKLQVANAEAQEANLQKEKFIQTISHEVRTPLNAIVGFSQVLDEMGDNFSEDEKEEFTRHIAESSEVLSKLIGDVLDLTSIESGRYEMKVEEVPVNALCREAVAQIGPMVAEGVKLNFLTSLPDSLTVTGDYSRMLQVLTNMLSNAAKFTEKGYITLTVGGVADKKIVRFAVVDSGIGIPEKEMDNIFERFKKLDTYKPGTGLGLYICRVIAQKLGGEISLDKEYSRHEKGSRFIFMVPMENVPSDVELQEQENLDFEDAPQENGGGGKNPVKNFIKKVEHMKLVRVLIIIAFWLGGVAGMWAQHNSYHIHDSIYPLYTQAFKLRHEPQGLVLADSMRQIAIALKDRDSEMSAMTIPVYYYFKHAKSFEEYQEKALKPLMDKAEAYGAINKYYLCTSNGVNYLCNKEAYMEAMILANQYLDYAKRKKHKLGIILCMHAQGVVCQTRGEYQQAVQWYREAIEYSAKNLPSYSNMADYQGLAQCYRDMGDFEKMLEVVEEGLKGTQNKEALFALHVNRSYAYFLLGRDKDFLALTDSLERNGIDLYVGSENLRTAVEIGKSIHHGDLRNAFQRIATIDVKSEQNLLYAQYYIHTGQPRKATQYYQNLLKMRYEQDEATIRADLKGMEKKLGLMHRQQEQEQTERENAQLELENTRLELDRSSMQLEGVKRATRLTQLEAQEAEEELVGHQLENRRTSDSLTARRLRQERHSNQMRIESIFFGSFLVVFLVVIGLIISHIRSIRKNNHHMKKANEALKESNAQLHIAHDRAQEGNRMKTRFVQNMSHEIRTPLNAIAGFSQVLHEMGSDLSDEEKAEMHNMITDNAALLITLVDDILDMAALESGKYTLEMTKVPVNDLCRQMLETVRHRLPQGVELRYREGVDDTYCITTDRKRTSQVIINLLTNAEKNTQKGHIVLYTTLKERPGYLTFVVEDTGIGVPKDKMKTIFQRFQQLSNRKQGAGLGLDICRTITTKMGGEIDIDPTYTGGARFWFTLPVDK